MTTIYSTIGGLKAVVWVDVIQAFVMIYVQTVILIKSVSDAGGFSQVLDYYQQPEINKLTWPNFRVNVYEPNNFWNMMIPYAINMWGSFTINQIAMQRLLACKSIKHGQTALYMIGPLFAFVTIICCGIGLCLAKIYQSADLVEQGKIGANDQLLTYYVASDYFSGWTGFLGLYSAALYSGAISTVSSAQAALAQLTLKDFVIPIHKFWQQREYSRMAKQGETIDLDKIGNSEGLTAQQKLNLSKILMAVYGILSVILAFVASNIGDLLRPVLSLAAGFTGPFLGIFIVASMKNSTAVGCMAGGLISFGFTMFVIVGQIYFKSNKPISEYEGYDYFANLSYLIPGGLGAMVGAIACWCCSVIDRKFKKHV